jgi:predicted RNA-binding protein with PUA domain
MSTKKNDNGSYDVIVDGAKIGTVRRERSTGEWFGRVKAEGASRAVLSDEFRTRAQAAEWVAEVAR